MQAIINPSEDALFNIVSSVCNVEELVMMDVRAGVSGQPELYQHAFGQRFYTMSRGTRSSCTRLTTQGT
jgi:hypothetical protein